MSRAIQETLVDVSEVMEACKVMDGWRGRIAELPAWLREELAAVQATEEISVIALPDAVVADLSPRFRALIANLRAQERRR